MTAFDAAAGGGGATTNEGRAPDDVIGDRARRKSDVRRLWSASTTMRSVDNVRYNTREACGASGRSSV